MKPRSASLQVAHQKRIAASGKPCAAFGKSGIESLAGCTCKPSYFTFYRDSSGRIIRGDDGTGKIVGRTRVRRDAERWLAKLQARLDEGIAEPVRRQSIDFPAWVDIYRAGIDRRVARGKLKARTVRDYTETLTRAVKEIGHADLREIGQRELERFVESYGEKVSEATLGRALRELSACLSEAVDAEYLEQNPVRRFVKKLELDTAARGKDAFTDEELAKLWAVLARPAPRGGRPPEESKQGGADPIYPHLFRIAVATGARLGELLALDWDDVSLSEKTVRVRHTYNVLDGLTAPKTKSSLRTIHLTPAGVAEFEALAVERSSGPVFVGPHGERLNPGYVARVLTRAREAAGIPKLGESGLPRSFHSFRSTFDRRMLERGVNPEWVRRQLGHSGLELTLNHYGRAAEAAMLAEAEKITADL